MFHSTAEIYKELKNNPTYKILNENEFLKNRMILVGLGGSYSYGAERESSDLDVRGIILEQPKYILGSETFTEFVDSESDTTFWAINKVIERLLQANPNTFELFGLRPEQYFYIDPIGQELLDNYTRFISKRACGSFVGYCDNQLRRLQNALAREVPQAEKEFHILNSIMNASYGIQGRYHNINIAREEMDSYVSFANENLGSIYKFSSTKEENFMDNDHDLGKRFNSATRKLFRFKEDITTLDDLNELVYYIDKSDKDDMDCEIYFDAVFHHFPLRDFNGYFSEMRSVIKDYGSIGKRNKKKDDAHLNKHMASLIRTIKQGSKLLSEKKMETFLEGDDLALYKDILNGKYRTPNGGIDDSFYDLLNGLMKEFDYIKETTDAPDIPDFEWAENFKIDVNKKIANGYKTKLF